jgi:hypothetical protein
MGSLVTASAILGNGDVVVGAFIPGGLARWNGSSWISLGTGVSGDVYTLAALPNGDLGVGGSFLTAGSQAARYFGIWGLPPECRCDSIDFNNNGVFPENQDVIDFFVVLAGGSCSSANCNDIDFNNNTVYPEDADVIDFFNVLAGGECL